MNEIQEVQAGDFHEIIKLLVHSSKELEQQLDAALRPLGISGVKWYALRHLAEAGGQLSLGQLAEKLACVKSNATQLTDRLKAEKLVQRLPDPDDRRVILAVITPKGQECYAAGLAVVQAFERRALGDLQEDERRLLHRLLARMAVASTVTS